jgi:hypothetical protein
MGVFDELISGMAPEDRAVLDKYPELKGRITQDYDKLDKWDNWRRENWDEAASKTRAQVAAEQRAIEYERAMQELERSGFATPAPAVKQSPGFDEVMAQVKQELNNQAVGIQVLIPSVLKAQQRHMREFPDQEFDAAAVFDYMQKAKIYDAYEAWDRMTAKQRSENAEQRRQEHEAAHQRALQEAEERGAQREREKLAMGPDGRIPVDQTGAPPPMGHLQKRILDSAKGAQPEIPPEVGLGEGTLAQLGYEAYLKREREAAVTK